VRATSITALVVSMSMVAAPRAGSGPAMRAPRRSRSRRSCSDSREGRVRITAVLDGAALRLLTVIRLCLKPVQCIASAEQISPADPCRHKLAPNDCALDLSASYGYSQFISQVLKQTLFGEVWNRQRIKTGICLRCGAYYVASQRVSSLPRHYLVTTGICLWKL
jgi:hypothetical protein